MNPEVKTLWINALRSGEYQQTQGWLNKGTGFCCLGVLCDLYLKTVKPTDARWIDKVAPGDVRLFEFDAVTSADPDYPVSHSHNGASLPEPVQEWAGLSDDDPAVNYGQEEEQYGGGYERPFGALSEINDSGFTFTDIAQEIESQL